MFATDSRGIAFAIKKCLENETDGAAQRAQPMLGSARMHQILRRVSDANKQT
jgi:hypothetical protein